MVSSCKACGIELKYHPEDKPALCTTCDRCPSCNAPGMSIIFGKAVLCANCLIQLPIKKYIGKIKKIVIARAEQIMRFQLDYKG